MGAVEVLIEELYKINEYIWPVSFYRNGEEEINLKGKVTLRLRHARSEECRCF